MELIYICLICLRIQKFLFIKVHFSWVYLLATADLYHKLQTSRNTSLIYQQQKFTGLEKHTHYVNKMPSKLAWRMSRHKMPVFGATKGHIDFFLRFFFLFFFFILTWLSKYRKHTLFPKSPFNMFEYKVAFTIEKGTQCDGVVHPRGTWHGLMVMPHNTEARSQLGWTDIPKSLALTKIPV